MVLGASVPDNVVDSGHQLRLPPQTSKNASGHGEDTAGNASVGGQGQDGHPEAWLRDVGGRG